MCVFCVVENRTFEVHSPDGLRCCILRANTPSDASSWFNAIHAAQNVLVSRALIEVNNNESVEKALRGEEVQSMGWLCWKTAVQLAPSSSDENHVVAPDRRKQQQRTGYTWVPTFAALTRKNLLLYSVAPWSPESWPNPSKALPLVTTRLVNTSPGDQHNKFVVRTGVKDGVETHEFRCETHRDLAQWARSLVKGSHAEAMAMREFSCGESPRSSAYRLIFKRLNL
jgi:hypothetical protein